MSDERYYPGYLNKEEHLREEMRQRDMVESIIKGAQAQEKEKVLESLSLLLHVLEMMAQDLAEIARALKNRQIRTD